jgi:uncharacterized protein (UPF0210 family)
MFWNPEEIRETIRMIGSEHLDIRTVTMGVSLVGGPGASDLERLCSFVYNRVYERASRLVKVAQEVEDMLGMPIVNKRVSVTPMSLVCEGLETAEEYAAVAVTLDRVAQDIGIDYIAGYSALVHLGMTTGDERLIRSLPTVMAATNRVCASINLASSRTGINMDAVRLMGEVILQVAAAVPNGGGCSRLVVFNNAPEDNPFIAGAFHGVGGGDCVLNVGVSGPGVVLGALRRLKESGQMNSFADITETIKKMAFKITRAGELVGHRVVERLGPPVVFGAVDLSLAPTPALGDSIADILEIMGLESTGTHGTTAALAMLVDAVKKGGTMACSRVGGLSGAFIPVSEDAGMVRAVRNGTLSLDKLEAMTAVCSVGLDMVAVPGDTSAASISGIIADELAIGMVNNKTTAVRIVPLPGLVAGESIDLGGLLGELIAMKVNKGSQEEFIAHTGKIPPPITSVRN